VNELEQLKAALADRYKIVREIGVGGMATVYLAEDLKHRRQVALKVLRPELAATLGPERFLREITIEAGLNHPHILPLHDSGEAGGFLYFVMPYVEGASLRVRLAREGPLPVSETVRILRQVVDALSYAHARGVIHRDIKPDNILRSGHHIVIADFGVAKAVREAGGGQQLTAAGMPIGTPAYMAPEQAVGDPQVDHRTDVYAVGVLGYELLVGRPPTTWPGGFPPGEATEGTSAKLIAKHRPDVPRALSDMLERCLRTDPSERWSDAAELLTRLEAMATPSGQLSQPRISLPGTQVDLRYFLPVAAAVVALLVGIGLYIGGAGRGAPGPPSERPMLVVLPFENLGLAEDNYFAEGVTDALTTRLASLGALGVISRTSASQYRNTEKTAHQIGDELGVAYILEGTIQRERPADPTSRVRITPQLVRVSDDLHLWSSTYDEDISEVFRVQSEIAERVARALDVTLLEPVRQFADAQPTENLEAYEAYLRGRNYLWDEGWMSQDVNALRIAVDLFERAIRLDSSFALAYAELANAHRALYDGLIDPTDERLAQWKAAVDEALELAPDLPEAHLALGLYFYSSRVPDQERALREFEIVAERRPNDALARELTAALLAATGEWDRSLENAAWSAELDPLSPARAGFAGWLHMLARRYPEAERYLDRAISLAPDQADAYSNKMMLYLLWRGDLEQARQVANEMVRWASPAATALGLVQGARVLITTGAYDSIFGALSPASYRGPLPFNYFYVNAELARLRSNTERFVAYSDSLLRALQDLYDERPTDPTLNWYMAYAYAGAGRDAEAMRYATGTSTLLAMPGNALRSAYMQQHLIWIYAMISEWEAAIDQIQYLLSVPSSISLPYLRVEALPDSLRRHRRFQQLLAASER
jgi:serine/threonine-protein kinase